MINLSQYQKKLQLATIGAIIIGVLALLLPILFLNKKMPETPTLTVEKMIPPQNQTENIPQDMKTKKQKIIDSKIKVDKGDYIIYESADFKIIYLPSREIFFTTINKEPVVKNRENAQNWFKKFDLKQEDLCNFPVRLLVDFKLKNDNPDFNPLPDDCK